MMSGASINLRLKNSNSNEESKDTMYDANAAVISNPEADEIFQRLIAQNSKRYSFLFILLIFK